MGALNALGIEFLDSSGSILSPVGEKMQFVKSIRFSDEYKKYREMKLTLACDVENEFYGKNGAAYVFARQKGASEKDLSVLDGGLENLNRVYSSYSNVDLQCVKGSGAAGGLCGGLYSFFDCEIKSGFDYLNEKLSVEEKIKEADVVITGEGKTDFQTTFGKLPKRIADMSALNNKRCILLSGDVETGLDTAEMGFYKAYKIKNETITLEFAIKNAYNILVERAKEIGETL